MSSSQAVRFVALGHVTNDLLRGKVVPGGSALYSGLAAAHLGVKTLVVTSAGDDFTGRDLLATAGVEMIVTPAAKTTCFENRYDGGHRVQRVLARATDLGAQAIEGDVVFACPVIGEVTDAALELPPRVLVGAGLQGWLRDVDAAGMVHPKPLGGTRVLGQAGVVFVSREDLGGDDAALDRIVEEAPLVVCTMGKEGCLVFENQVAHHVFAHPTKEVDPTGAGDVFATAFLIASCRGSGPLEAAMFGCCAASVVVEAVGAGALPRLADIEDRVSWYRRNVPDPVIEQE